MVEDVIKQRLGKITKSKVAELCPSLSLSAIEKVIAKMVEEGKLEKKGAGKSTYYIIKNSFALDLQIHLCLIRIFI